MEIHSISIYQIIFKLDVADVDNSQKNSKNVFSRFTYCLNVI